RRGLHDPRELSADLCHARRARHGVQRTTSLPRAVSRAALSARARGGIRVVARFGVGRPAAAARWLDAGLRGADRERAAFLAGYVAGVAIGAPAVRYAGGLAGDA